MQIAQVTLSFLRYIITLEARAALTQYHRYTGNYYEEIPAT